MRTVAVRTVPSAGVSGVRESDTKEWVSRAPLSGLKSLLGDLPSPEAEQAAEILAGSASFEIEPGVPYLGASFPSATLLVVEEGFVVLRATFPLLARSMITCEAAPGSILLPPSPEEALFGLGSARVSAISAERRAKLLNLPAAAGRIVEQLTSALSQRQEAIANLASSRHVERVRRKLLQLARGYGHVVHDGIRIDFPVSHALLAEMIGSSRETVTRAVDELQRAGFVTRRGSTYLVRAPLESVLGPPPGM
jgi:Crp-like helix-turn-helix domain